MTTTSAFVPPEIRERRQPDGRKVRIMKPLTAITKDSGLRFFYISFSRLLDECADYIIDFSGIPKIDHDMVPDVLECLKQYVQLLQKTYGTNKAYLCQYLVLLHVDALSRHSAAAHFWLTDQHNPWPHLEDKNEAMRRLAEMRAKALTGQAA